MKPKVWFVLCIIFALLILGTPPSSRAADPPSAPNAPAYSSDPEAFRAWLDNYFTELENLYPKTEGTVPGGLAERIQTGKRVVAQLKPEELAVLKDAFDKNPALVSAPKDLKNALNQAAKARKSPEAGEVCPPGVDGGTIALFVFKAVALGTEQAFGYVPGDMVVMGTTITVHPAKLVLSIINDVFEWVIFGLETADEVNGDCEQNNAQSIVVEKLNVSVDSRASEQTLTKHDSEIKTLLKQYHESTAKLIKKNANQDPAANKQVSVVLQVVEISSNQRFLVSATEAGQPLANVQFTSVQVSGADQTSFADVTAGTSVSMPTKGVYLVTLPNAVNAKSIVIFSVKQENNAADRYGFTMFAVAANKNLGGK